MNKIEKLVYDASRVGMDETMVITRSNKRANIYNQGIRNTVLDREEELCRGDLLMIVKNNYFWEMRNDELEMRNDDMTKSGVGGMQGNQHSSFLISHSSFKEVATSYAWGYHKGCRLQWLGDSNDTFIFNTARDGQLCAEIHQLSHPSPLTSYLSYPIDTVSWDGRYATSFSYRRLNELMPGYGYDIEDGSYLDEGHPADTGLYIVDVEKNTRRLLFSLDYLASLEPTENMKGARHFVTHTEFSKDNQYVIFMHRWIHDDPDKRFSRLITCRLDGSELYISPTTDMVSHYVWDEKWGILAFCRINNVDGHYLFSDHTMKRWRHVAPQLNSDGHQSFIPGADAFITDTYPDGRRYAKLWRVDLNTDETKLLADLKSPKEFQSPNCYKNWCCDLHPRVSPQGTYVTFDSVHTNHRALCVMKL